MAHSSLHGLRVALAMGGLLFGAELSQAQPAGLPQGGRASPAQPYGSVLMADDFLDPDMTHYFIVDEGEWYWPSAWKKGNGHLDQMSNIYGPDASAVDHRKGTFAVWNDSAAYSWTDYSVSVGFRNMDDDGVGVLFRYQSVSNYYKLELDSQRGFRKLSKMFEGTETSIAAETGGYMPGADNRLQVVVLSNSIVARLNGVSLFGGAVTDSSLPVGSIALYSWGSVGISFSNLTVSSVIGAPTLSLLSPEAGAVFREGDVIPLIMSVSEWEAASYQVTFLDHTELIAALSSQPYSFYWSNALPGPHRVVAVVSDMGNIVNISEVSIQVIPREGAPRFTQQPRAQTVGLGGGVLFEATASGGSDVRYQWHSSGGPIAGATNRLLILNGINAGSAGNYWATAANSVGMASSIPALLTIDATSSNGPADCPCVQGLSIAAFNEHGEAVLRLALASQARVTVEATSGILSDWTPLASLTNPCFPFFLCDRGPADRGTRFYRVRPTVRIENDGSKLIAWGQLASAVVPSPPGNSLPAVERSYELGYDGVEMDVMLTGDGVPVLTHGLVINGTNAPLANYTFAGLQQVSLGTWKGEPVRIRSLEEALRLNGSRGPFFADMRVDASQVEAVRSAVERAGFDQRLLYITAYTIEAGVVFKRAMPLAHVVRKWYNYPKDLPFSEMERVAQAGLDGAMLQMPAGEDRIDEFVNRLHCRGLSLTLFVHYPQNTLNELQRLVDAGCDYILTVHHEFRPLLHY